MEHPHSVSVASLRYTFEGDGEGARILLIHGLGGRGGDWRPQAEALRQTRRVLAVDLRGHGGSPAPPGPWQMADIARDVASLLRALETGPVHVVGISLGGMVAFQLMADHPELVRSAVIINSGPAFPGRTWKGFVALWSRVLILRWKGLPALGETIARRLFPRPEQADARRAFAEQFVRNDQSSYERSLRAIGRFDVSARLGDVRCPVLALASDHDYTPLADHEAWVRRSPGARLEVIRDAGHASTVDQPEAVNRAVLAFLEAVESSPRP